MNFYDYVASGLLADQNNNFRSKIILCILNILSLLCLNIKPLLLHLIIEPSLRSRIKYQLIERNNQKYVL